MKVTIEVTPEFRKMVIESVESCKLNNASHILLSRLVQEWARHTLDNTIGTIVLDVPIPQRSKPR